MGVLSKIKDEAKKSGTSKEKFLYCREDQKIRIRFLSDLDDGGIEIPFHDSFAEGINVPCQELYGKTCPYCDMDGLRTRNLFAWSVYDYEDKEVKILMQASNPFTAVPALSALYEDYGTLLDRDLTIKRTGSGQKTSYTVVPLDKNKFRNEKAKPLTKKAILKYLAAAYPPDSKLMDDDEDEIKSRRHAAVDDDIDDDDTTTEEYGDMSPQELYKLCKERKIDAMTKKNATYYVKLLEEYDKASDDWEEDEDEADDWED